MKSNSQLRLVATAAVLLALSQRAVHAQRAGEVSDDGIAVTSATAWGADPATIASASSRVSFDFAADDPAPAAVGDEDKWWFQPSIAIWAPSINGTVGAHGLTTDVDESFIDILDNSDSIIGIMGTFEMGKGKWSGFVNGMYTKIGVEHSTPFGTADLTSELSILGFGISYEIGRWPMECASGADHRARDMTLQLYAGGRYTSVENDVDFAVAALPTIKHDKSWVDPIVGAALNAPLSPSWSVVLNGNVGGFGVASDFAWAAAGLISWDFYIGDLPSSLQFGYIAIGDDYSSGSGTNRFVWDTILYGPALNFAVRF